MRDVVIRDVVWDWVDRAGLEHLRLERGNDGVRAEGRVVVAAERGAVVVPSFDDRHIIAGQGTAGLEILAQCPEPVRQVLEPVADHELDLAVDVVQVLQPAILFCVSGIRGQREVRIEEGRRRSPGA